MTNTISAVMCLSLSLCATSLLAQTTNPATSRSANKPVAVKGVASAAPPIPEEARKHFVMGATLFKDAKTADDLAQVVSEFKRATDLAPQWPDARYNLALAKEAAADFSGAIAELAIYQHFKLSDAEARVVQDKIYALEAKKDSAAKKQAEETTRQAAQAAAEKRQKEEASWPLAKFKGVWAVAAARHIIFVTISDVTSTGAKLILQDHDEEVIAVENNQLRMREVRGNIVNYTTLVLTGDNTAHFYFYQTSSGTRAPMMDNDSDLVRTSK